MYYLFQCASPIGGEYPVPPSDGICPTSIRIMSLSAHSGTIVVLLLLLALVVSICVVYRLRKRHH